MRGVSLLPVLALALLAGCPASDDGPVDTDRVIDTDSDTDSDSDTDTDTGAPTDEDLVRDAIAADDDPAPLLAEIAWRDGWPVATDDGTWLFVADARVTPDPALAGTFNDWTPTSMEGTGDLRWLEVEAEVGDTYKLVTGETFVADPHSRAYAYDDFGRISLVGWPRDRWHLQRWPDVEGAGLSPRDLRVLVPPGEGPWPVLYAHDGQNLFDPDAPWGGWRLQPSVEALDVEVLVVGIDNTPDRLSDYATSDDTIGDLEVTGHGSAYAELVHDTIRPHVEEVYGSTGVDGLLGSSMGGLASLHIALEDPGDWDFAASMSGTLGWGRFDPARDGPTIEERYLATDPLDLVVFVDSGGSDGGDGCTDPDGDGFFEDDPNATDNYCTTRAFADGLAEHGYAWGETLHHWHEAGAPHNEGAWAARVSRPLEVFADLASEQTD